MSCQVSRRKPVWGKPPDAANRSTTTRKWMQSVASASKQHQPTSPPSHSTRATAAGRSPGPCSAAYLLEFRNQILVQCAAISHGPGCAALMAATLPSSDHQHRRRKASIRVPRRSSRGHRLPGSLTHPPSGAGHAGQGKNPSGEAPAW